MRSGFHTKKAYGIQLLKREPHNAADTCTNQHRTVSDHIASNEKRLMV